MRIEHAVATRRRRRRRAASGPTVVVTNEVGLGVHPDTELGRQYRDVLGRVNQHLGRAPPSRSLLLVAGRALPLARSLGVPA